MRWGYGNYVRENLTPQEFWAVLSGEDGGGHVVANLLRPQGKIQGLLFSGSWLENHQNHFQPIQVYRGFYTDGFIDVAIAHIDHGPHGQAFGINLVEPGSHHGFSAGNRFFVHDVMKVTEAVGAALQDALHAALSQGHPDTAGRVDDQQHLGAVGEYGHNFSHNAFW